MDIAAGEGSNALWLAERGRHATAVDFWDVAPTGAALAQQRLGDDAGVLETCERTSRRGFRRRVPFDLVLVVYLHLPQEQRSAIMASAASAVDADGTLLILSHDLENLTAGHGGPHHPSVLYRPADIVADIAPQQMIIVRAETGVRPLTDSQGRPAQALDALVVARRALT